MKKIVAIGLAIWDHPLLWMMLLALNVHSLAIGKDLGWSAFGFAVCLGALIETSIKTYGKDRA